jgi:glutathione S-transferase
MLHPLSALITCFAIVLYVILAAQVGRARGLYKIAAPATTGHPDFERIFRVQQNTMEGLVAFIPSLWLFTWYISANWAAGIGFFWIAARVWYAIGYTAAAEKRGAGFGLSMLALGVLLIGSILGAGFSLFSR